MSSQRRVGFALVGVGSIGEVHGSNLANKIHNARLEALVDSDRKRLGSAAGRFGVSKAYTDYDRVLADDQVELVSSRTRDPPGNPQGVADGPQAERRNLARYDHPRLRLDQVSDEERGDEGLRHLWRSNKVSQPARGNQLTD